MKTNLIIPFNEWSKQRIRMGKKFCTSRHKRYLHDSRVVCISSKIPWCIIKLYFWSLEGADSPEELQEVIEGIYKRKVLDDEEFYLHFGEWREKLEK